MTNIDITLQNQLKNLSIQNLYRRRCIIESPQGVNVCVNGKQVVNFCSNDYLGLANHPDIILAFKKAADHYGIGSGSAHLICGHSSAHHALEEELADFTGRERALLFSTGYMANLGVITALVGHGDSVFEDRLNHASLLDGGLSSDAQFKRYRHQDVAQLTQLLHQAKGNKLIVTDGVFSMDGDFAPLIELAQTAKENNSWLMVDDAHGLGVIGKQGAGLLDYYDLSTNDVPILMGTFGKGFGTFGAFVAGSETLIESLIQKAKTYIYTTALPPAIAEATRASLAIIRNEHWRRDRVNTLTDYFKARAKQLNLPIMPSSSAIQPIMIGESKQANALSEALFQEGFLVSAIRPPTVPKGTARLRITFSALHEEWQIDNLLAVINRFFIAETDNYASTIQK